MAAATTKGELTRKSIIEAALRLFLERGYHGTSMRQIAQRANIALGGIYNHFHSKEEIFLAVLMAHHPYYEVLPALQAAQGETIEEYVRDAAARLASNFNERFEFINLMFIELVEFKGQHIQQIYNTVFPNVIRYTEQIIQRNQNKLRPIPGVILARAFIGLFFSFVLTELLIAHQLPSEMSENALEYMIEIYLHGVMMENPASIALYPTPPLTEHPS